MKCWICGRSETEVKKITDKAISLVENGITELKSANEMLGKQLSDGNEKNIKTSIGQNNKKLKFLMKRLDYLSKLHFSSFNINLYNDSYFPLVEDWAEDNVSVGLPENFAYDNVKMVKTIDSIVYNNDLSVKEEMSIKVCPYCKGFINEFSRF